MRPASRIGSEAPFSVITIVDRYGVIESIYTLARILTTIDARSGILLSESSHCSQQTDRLGRNTPEKKGLCVSSGRGYAVIASSSLSPPPPEIQGRKSKAARILAATLVIAPQRPATPDSGHLSGPARNNVKTVGRTPTSYEHRKSPILYAVRIIVVRPGVETGYRGSTDKSRRCIRTPSPRSSRRGTSDVG